MKTKKTTISNVEEVSAVLLTRKFYSTANTENNRLPEAAERSGAAFGSQCAFALLK